MKTDKMFCVHTTAFYRRHNCSISRFEHAHSKQNIEPAIVPSTANCLRGFRRVLLASLNFFKLEVSRRKKQTTNARDKKNYFSWSDDEVELLLSSTIYYKTSKEMEKWRKRIQKVPDTKSSLSTLIQKSCVFKLFHSRERIPKVPFSRIFLCGYVRCSVDGRPNRNNKVALSNLSGIVWTRP